MNWLILVNDSARVGSTQSTTSIALEAARRGHDVYFASAVDLDTLPGGDQRAWARKLPAGSPTPRAAVRALAEAPRQPMSVDDMGLVLVRTSPGRHADPAAHVVLLQQLLHMERRGLPVWNRPSGLLAARSKLYMSELSADVRPRSMVSRDRCAIEGFLRELNGPAVIKPLGSTQGRDVFFLDRFDAPNSRAIIDVILRGGHALVQAWVEEGVHGDVRLLLLDGEVIASGPRVAAVRRRPAPGELRSNIHLGGSIAPADNDDTLRMIAAMIGPQLRQDGLLLVGVDVIGDKVVECNVFSPGGLDDAGLLVGADVVGVVVDELERRAVN